MGSACMREGEKRIPELLSPAGDSERLDAALLYGADAVYLAGTRYGMRSAPANFDEAGLREAVRRSHARGVKVYVTCNILPRNGEMDSLPAYLELLQDSGVDALIVADLGVLALARRHAPRCRLHISTQWGVVNYETARQLHDMGADRVVLARELSLDEVAEIRARTPQELQLECFVHGAMCMSYSGRCLLSAYMTGRDANHGDCAQPCRWKFQFTESNRPDRIWTAEEEEQGTYLFNANDLCMLGHIAVLSDAGVGSFKIEGRAKAPYYVAVITNAYRMALDDWRAQGCPSDYRPPEWLMREPMTVSHRPYGTGFYFGEPRQDTSSGGYVREYEVAAAVEGWENGLLYLSQRNRFCEGDTLEILEPGKRPEAFIVRGMTDAQGNEIDAAPHPTMKVCVPYPRPLTMGAFLRRSLTA